MRMSCNVLSLAVAALFCAARAVAQEAPAPPQAPTAYAAGSVPTYAELDKGEKATFALFDGSAHSIELVDFNRQSAKLRIDGREENVSYRPADMPKVVAGMRVGVDITKAWVLLSVPGVTAFRSVSEIVRVPLPFICSK